LLVSPSIIMLLRPGPPYLNIDGRGQLEFEFLAAGDHAALKPAAIDQKHVGEFLMHRANHAARAASRAVADREHCSHRRPLQAKVDRQQCADKGRGQLRAMSRISAIKGHDS
jgi:hypothetical protein